jgi:pyruvate kinase
VYLETGAQFIITTRDIEGTVERVSTTYQPLPTDVQPGDRILLSDGLIELRVLESADDEVRTEIVVGGELRERQGVNLPGVNISSPALTPKDAEDLDFGLAQEVDYVALSFVRHASDITDIKKRIVAAGKDTPVIAKIEKPEALEHFGEIVKVADAIMVARGDLGVEIPAEEVPSVQKRLIDVANDAGVPVITATQMLDSMMHHSRPTRAEVSDVANAIIDGTDAVMLSGETAAGRYPVESVTMMAKIAEVADRSRRTEHDPLLETRIPPQHDIPQAISEAANALVEALAVDAIVARTLSGTTARLISKQRPRVPILALTPIEKIYRRLNLFWGVMPVWTRKRTNDTLEKAQQVYDALVEHHLAEPGNRVVLVGGYPFAARGPTNFLQIVQIGSERPTAADVEQQ